MEQNLANRCLGDERDSLPNPIPTEQWDFSPLFYWEWGQRRRVQLLGPLYEYSEVLNAHRMGALRPLLSREEDLYLKRVEQDILYPLLSYRLNDIYLSCHALIGLAWDANIWDEESEWQQFLLPFYFLGRDSSGHLYGGLFPLAGDLRDIFSYRRIQYLLFPLWMKTEKSTGTVNYHILWPIFHRADGPMVEKRKIFPFLGYAQQKDQWYQAFVLWPFFHWGYSLAPHIQGSAFFFFPFFGTASSRNQKNGNQLQTYTVFWPFFNYTWRRYSHTQGWRLYAPWPFFIYEKDLRSPGDLTIWLWPFFGKTIKEDRQDFFWFWPLIFYYQRSIPAGVRYQTVVGVIFFRDYVVYKNHTWDSFHRIWPLCNWSRTSSGDVSVQFLDLIPLRNISGINRNWVPLYTLYRYQRRGDTTSQNLLWGLWRWETQENVGLRYFHLFPFFSWADYPQEFQNVSILGGIYKHQIVQQNYQFHRWLWLIHYGTHKNEIIRHGFFPLYSYQRSPSSTARDIKLLTGLIGYGKSEDGQSYLRLLWFLKIPLAGKSTD